MSYEVHLKHVPPEHVVTKRTHTTFEHIGETIGEALQSVARSLDPPGAFSGPPFAIYHGVVNRAEDVDIEAGFPAQAGAVGDGEAKDFSGGPVAYTIHRGAYEQIGAAYDAISAWCEEHGILMGGPPREIYLVGPSADTKPEDYQTEIEIPVLS